jgi:twitching motility two-component system response regulator PilG
VGRTIYPFVKHGWIQLIDPLLATSPTINKDLQLFSAEKIPCIACIDDSIAVCKSVESTLQLEGYEATSCSNPLEFLNLVFQIEPDLILCDIAMPELNGYELCAMLRCSNMFRQTPIVMLTGKDWFIDRVRARMVGATDYLTKPFTERELLMIVEKHLQLNRIHSTPL